MNPDIIKIRIAMTDFSAGMDAERLEKLKGLILAVTELDNEIQLLDKSEQPEKQLELIAIGKAFTEWCKGVVDNARNVNVN